MMASLLEALFLLGLDLWPVKGISEQAVFDVIKSAECAGNSKKCIKMCLDLKDDEIDKALDSLEKKNKIVIKGGNIKLL